MDLFEECIEALKDPKEILSDELTEQYFETLNNKFPITSWARIDWGKVPQKESIETYDDLNNWLNSQGIEDTTINLLWNPSDVPVVRTTLENALEVLDDVLAVGSDTFMYSDHGFVIEFFHDGEVTIGRAE